MKNPGTDSLWGKKFVWNFLNDHKKKNGSSRLFRELKILSQNPILSLNYIVFPCIWQCKCTDNIAAVQLIRINHQGMFWCLFLIWSRVQHILVQ